MDNVVASSTATLLNDSDTNSDAASGESFTERFAAAARVVYAATKRGFVAPRSVCVSEQCCSAQLDTPDLLAWAEQFDGRPAVTTYVGSAHISVRGEIDGWPWELHNGVPEPVEGEPWTAPAGPAHPAGPVSFPAANSQAWFAAPPRPALPSPRPRGEQA